MAEPRRLAVWCFGRIAGTLTDERPELRFEYEPDWLEAGMPPLSHALPLDGAFAPGAPSAFFGGLLPEGTPRNVLARRLGVSAGNDFGLLAAVGGDTAGAISLLPPGTDVEPDAGAVEWLGDGDLVRVLDELPTRPMQADADGEYRLSLAGAQDKLPVVVGPDGRIGLTTGRTPSTHILKPPIERLPGTVPNEAFCLALGRGLGIETAGVSPRRVEGREFLLVERYDRSAADDGRITRLHQEDCCQALGVPSSRKYQAEGGPSLADCFALIRETVAVPAADVLRLLDLVALSFLVGNNDAHGKNYSLLYAPLSSRARLAPGYDIVSTVAYQRTHDLSRKMAMSIGGEYRPDYVDRRHLGALFDAAGLGAAAARRRLGALAAAAPAAAQSVRAELAALGWDAPVLDDVLVVVDRRARALTQLTARA